MSKRFVPVSDPERPRCEQDEQSLRKHRQFDTPHAKLADDLNKPRTPKQDMNPLGRPTGKLAKDEEGLWRNKDEVKSKKDEIKAKKEEIRAKNDLFDKKQTWGRETFEYSNPEEARADGGNNRKRKPGEVSWGVKGTFGGRGEDTGVLVLQRGEVDQRMELNEKGLWVKKKKEGGAESSEHPRPPSPGAQRDMLLAAKPGEDPRLEAAKQKGRGGADAAAKALKALQERRNMEKKVQEEMGMRGGGPRDAPRSGPVTTLNSSSQQVKPQRRVNNIKRWQGVQRTDEEAREIVGKAEGCATIGHTSGSSGSKPEDSAASAPDPLRKRGRSESPDVAFAWESGSDRSASRSRSRPRSGGGGAAASADGAAGDIEVDFF